MNNNRNFRMLLLGVALFSGVSMLRADVYEDDIYYNPKTDKTAKTHQKKQSNYIADFQDQDVDAYNRRGQYYVTEVDTIGEAVGQGQDFVYTQEIQKYYNPTIVVDNADVVNDILENSYGNVEVVYNINGVPTFSPCYTYPSFSMSWGIWGPSFSVSWGGPYWGPSWNWGWGWGPSWSWNWGWGPSWAWGPTWGPAWGPSWGWGWGGPVWGPSYGPGWGGNWHYADYRPNGRRPGVPNPGWAHNTRPGGNRYDDGYHGGNYGRYPGGSHGYGKPGTSAGNNGGNVAGSTNRPYVSSNGHRVYGNGADLNGQSTNTVRPSGTNTGSRPNVSNADKSSRPTLGTATVGSMNNRNNSGASNTGTIRQSGSSKTNSNATVKSFNSNGHRTSGYNSNSTVKSNSNNTNRSNSYNSNRSNSYNSNRSSGSYRSSGSGSNRGSYGGGSHGYGGSRGGGGGRGGHR